MKHKDRIKKNGCLEGCICELFSYLFNLGVYPNSSDMNELYAMQERKR